MQTCIKFSISICNFCSRISFSVHLHHYLHHQKMCFKVNFASCYLVQKHCVSAHHTTKLEVLEKVMMKFKERQVNAASKVNSSS